MLRANSLDVKLLTQTGAQGFEPRPTDLESVVLPVRLRPRTDQDDGHPCQDKEKKKISESSETGLISQAGQSLPLDARVASSGKLVDRHLHLCVAARTGDDAPKLKRDAARRKVNFIP